MTGDDILREALAVLNPPPVLPPRRDVPYAGRATRTRTGPRSAPVNRVTGHQRFQPTPPTHFTTPTQGTEAPRRFLSTVRPLPSHTETE